MAETVTVGCKLPNGLILRLFKLNKAKERVLGGGVRDVEVAEELPHSITLNGFAHGQNRTPNCLVIGGFALTSGVPKAFFEEWMSQNKDADLVKNGLIFANTKPIEVEAQAKDKVSVRSGLERLDPGNLPKSISQATKV